MQSKIDTSSIRDRDIGLTYQDHSGMLCSIVPIYNAWIGDIDNIIPPMSSTVNKMLVTDANGNWSWGPALSDFVTISMTSITCSILHSGTVSECASISPGRRSSVLSSIDYHFLLSRQVHISVLFLAG